VAGERASVWRPALCASMPVTQSCCTGGIDGNGAGEGSATRLKSVEHPHVASAQRSAAASAALRAPSASSAATVAATDAASRAPPPAYAATISSRAGDAAGDRSVRKGHSTQPGRLGKPDRATWRGRTNGDHQRAWRKGTQQSLRREHHLLHDGAVWE